ncbi:MAG TPA: tRNA (adenosine(37)-N6)-threonylcarbamoyltransferase complex dimerization subunit type 1 TsaB, partial [Paracoccaceae bacterium]|nr:tRNA (adenosine(37)-N6)-threonylcarbamoyltransferase complex dimerization subunit type 1 TsaB [Paracoccaceae bacterium]
MRPDLLILGFDTSAAHCAAALLSGGRVLAAVEEPMATGQAERLMPMLEGMLAAQGLGWRDLSRIGVGTGPGNFTGVRIAVAAARGLALGLGVPAGGGGGVEAAGPCPSVSGPRLKAPRPPGPPGQGPRAGRAPGAGRDVGPCRCPAAWRRTAPSRGARRDRRAAPRSAPTAGRCRR